MIKKLLCVLVFSFTAIGCDDLRYSGSSKVVYTGRVTDASEVPMSGVHTRIFVTKEGYPSNLLFPGSAGANEVIAYTTTDGDGNYTMIFPTPQNESYMSLLVNSDENGLIFNNTYSSASVYHLGKPGAEDDFTIDMSNIKLFNIEDSVTLTVIANNYNYNITPVGAVDKQLIHYNEAVHNRYPYTLTANNQRTYTFQVAKNQTILLRYTFGEYIDNYYTEVPVYIDNNPVTYTIE